VPVAKNPEAPEFYVYHLVVGGTPFYVGIGRSARAADRVRYVRYLLDRESRGNDVHWGLSTRVIARLLEAGHDVQVVYPRKGMTRLQALAEERRQITRLLARKLVLANVQGNPRRPKSAEEVLDSLPGVIRAGRKKRSGSGRAAGRMTSSCS
jgi:hypothetical protein